MDQDGAVLQERLQSSVTKVMKQLEQSKVRPLQKKTYLCMAGCVESSSTPDHVVNNCIENCSTVVNAVNEIISQEMNSFQNRIQRCSMSCQDEFNDKITPDMRENPKKLEQARKQSMGCLNSCVNKHIDLLKSIQGKLEQEIDHVQLRK
eukprot:gene11584-24225_t